MYEEMKMEWGRFHLQHRYELVSEEQGKRKTEHFDDL